MLNLRQYHAVVEQAIANLGLSPAECLDETEAGVWRLRKGSAQITVRVYVHDESQVTYCRVICPLMPSPTQRREELFDELLELNMNYIGITFGKTAEWIYLKADREAEGLDVNEMYYMLNRVGVLADHYDDILEQKYGVGRPRETGDGSAHSARPSENGEGGA